jgi:hypothetical protein
MSGKKLEICIKTLHYTLDTAVLFCHKCVEIATENVTCLSARGAEGISFQIISVDAGII